MPDPQPIPDARLETLRQATLDLLGKPLAPDFAAYAASLPRALDRAATSDEKLRGRILDQIEMLIAAFKVSEPDDGLIAELVANLREVHAEARSGFEGRVLRWAGGSPLWAALFGAMFSVGATIYLLFAFVLMISNYMKQEFSLDPLVFTFMAFGAIGGAVTSVLTRLGDFAAMGRAKIELVFLNALVKPIVAVFLSITVVALFASDAVNIAGFDIQVAKIVPGTPDYLKQLAIFWSVGFLSGFSERFARDVVGRVDPPGGAPQPSKPGK
jgi:hypothetical protein